VATAVFCQAMCLPSFDGLPVAPLRLPVNPASSQKVACVTTIGLTPEAPAAHAEPQPTPTAVHLHQKQKMASDLAHQPEAMVHIGWFVELLAVCGALLKARSWRFGLSFLFLQKANR